MEATLREEGGCVVAVEVMRAVQEVAREGVAFRKMEVAVAMCLVEAAANLRLHDPLEKSPKRHERFNYQTRESSLYTPDLKPRYQHSKAPSRRFKNDLLTLPVSSIASAMKMSCRQRPVTILILFTAALVTWYSTVAKIPRCAQVYRLGRYLHGARPYLHD